jgi:hypothetical protein
MAYYRHDLPALVRHAQAGLAMPVDTDPVAHAGIHLWVALAPLYAGEAAASRPWQLACRSLATRAGDDATVASLVYNTAELRVAHVRHAELGDGNQAALPALLASVNSADNYERAVGIASLQVLNPLLRAKVLVVEGQFAEAVALYDAHLQTAVEQGLQRLESSLLADLAWCHAQLGHADQARQLAASAEQALTPQVDHDDRGVTHGRVAQVHGLLAQPEEAARHQALARSAWAAFAELQSQWRAGLAASGLQPSA